MSRNLGTKELAQQLGVSEQTIRYHARKGAFPYDPTPGGHRRYDLDEVRAARRRRRCAHFARAGSVSPTWRSHRSGNSVGRADAHDALRAAGDRGVRRGALRAELGAPGASRLHERLCGTRQRALPAPVARCGRRRVVGQPQRRAARRARSPPRRAAARRPYPRRCLRRPRRARGDTARRHRGRRGVRPVPADRGRAATGVRACGP